MNSEASPPQQFRKVKDDEEEDDENEENDENYDEEYEEEPVPTKPFDGNKSQDPPNSQEDVLKMINNPVERPTTRNPRMQRKADRGSNQAQREEGLGDFGEFENNPESLKIKEEIKGVNGFELPGDSDED